MMYAARFVLIAVLSITAGCSGEPLGSSPPLSAGEQISSIEMHSLSAQTGVAQRFESRLLFDATSRSTAARPHVSGLFVADFGAQAVEVLKNKTYAKLATITTGVKGPDGDWVDANGNLYVANYKGRNVTEYARGSTKPTCTYSRRLIDPINVTTDASGDVFVVDWNFGGDRGTGYIDEYKQCTNTIAERYIVAGGPEGVAVDSSGNLFISYLTSENGAGVGAFEEFPAGSKRATSLGATVAYPGGLVVDRSGNLLACDQTSGTVDVISPPYTSINSRYVGFTAPLHIALTRDEKLLFVADIGARNVVVLSYPRGLLKAKLGKAQGLSDPAGVSDAPNAVF